VQLRRESSHAVPTATGVPPDCRTGDPESAPIVSERATSYLLLDSLILPSRSSSRTLRIRDSTRHRAARTVRAPGFIPSHSDYTDGHQSTVIIDSSASYDFPGS